MANTRLQMIQRVQNTLGDTSAESKAVLEEALDDVLFYLWDLHDWTFKHKVGTFDSVVGTEEYDLSATSADIRSSRDIDILYNKTEGIKIQPIELRQIRTAYPKEDQNDTPNAYAPWGTKSIVLSTIPNEIQTYKYLYTAKPILPTADGDDMETVTGTPDYVQHLLKALLMKQGMEYYDDIRYGTKVREIEQVLIPRAIQADMRYLEHNFRFKDWEEEMTSQNNPTFDDYLRHLWGNNGC